MRRPPVTLAAVPDLMVKALLAAEVDRFFSHPGVEYQGLLRAGWVLLTTGQKAQGGSTITMQVARNFFLGREKTYLRKLNEIMLAIKIEHEFTKQEILELYLNKIYLGQRAYGIAAAAEVYYGVNLPQLSLAQMAMIAGLPKAPSRYNPVADPPRALSRRNYVLGRMRDLGYITAGSYATAIKERDGASVHVLPVEAEAPYLAEMVRAEILQRYGEGAYTTGIKVYRAVQATRQPGSAFKPFVYSAALEHGMTPATVINDAPVVFDDPELEETWRPENYSGRFYGPTRLREALVQSRNLVSIRVLRAIGISDALEYVAHFGFDKQALPRNLSLALGSGGTTPLTLASAYAVFANTGFASRPT